MGQLFGISGYLVVGCNFASHKDGLGESDGTCIHIAGIGVQRIDQPLPYAIQFVPYAGDERSQRLEQGAQFGAGSGQLLESFLDRPLCGGSYVADSSFLVIA